ncbi:hypothetical protein HK405_003150, partial [Cladochytrium tenue]
VKCDGVRPVCGNCAKRMSRRCVFLGLKARVDPALAQRNRLDIARALDRRNRQDVEASAASLATTEWPPPTGTMAAPQLPLHVWQGPPTSTLSPMPRPDPLDDDLEEALHDLGGMNIFDIASSTRLDPDPDFTDRRDDSGKFQDLLRPSAPYDEERRLAEAFFDDYCGPVSFIHRRSYFNNMRRLPTLLRY